MINNIIFKFKFTIKKKKDNLAIDLFQTISQQNKFFIILNLNISLYFS